VVFVTSVAIVGKFFGAWLGTFGSSLSKYDRLSVGIAFTPSGMTEIIIAKIALEHQIITLAVFVAMVCSALISSLLVGPGLVWSIRRRPRVHILEFFLRSAIVPQLQGHTQAEVIQELCQAVARGDPRLNAKTLAVAVQTREELMGTGIGYSIAIPHSRIAGLTKPVLTVGRSLSGVHWDSPDGIPVQLVFLLLTPTQDDSLQLQTIATLARALSSETVRHRLTHAATEQQIWHVLQDVLRSRSLAPVQVDEHAV
jgi:mannitol/fructose-specific phosphotransferase system IIA component (Ntr-type)